MRIGSSRCISRCQVSGSENLESILFLGYVPPVNYMQPVGSRPEEQCMYPLELLYCPDSHLVQIGCEVDPEILFPPEYPYTSGTTRILRENFADLYEVCRERLGLEEGSLVVDIGSNDGTLLHNFLSGGCQVLGIEPTDRGALAEAKGVRTVNRFFSSRTATEVAREFGQAALVTAANVFAHIQEIDQVVDGILELMDEDGVFVSESHYLLDLIHTLQFDTVYHEHLRYYSLHSLQALLEKHGLEVFDVQRIPTHGGSIRVFASRKGKRCVSASVSALLAEEEAAGLLCLDTYREFGRRVMQFKLDLMNIVREVKQEGKRIYGIGAPSRASTLITYTGLDHDAVTSVMEVAGSHKIGRYMPGTRIPVEEETRLFEDQPEYALLFSWHIADELMPKLIEKGFKGDFIVPLPDPRVLSIRKS